MDGSKGSKSGRMGLQRFFKNRDGATAIEFSILALPFLMIVFAVIETSVSFTAQQLMSNTADQLGRQIRTGQISAASKTQAEFKQLICDKISLLVSSGCPELEFDLKSYPNFASVPKTIPMSSPKVLNTAGFSYSPGGSGTINQLRIFYRWPIMTDLMKQHMAGLENGKTLLFASTTWQNEPF
ncbi:MAG: TadE/TadG family type IV pilus assembly protein [Ahrensia sp.]|nr:TadE/TadG family type IV pilus assembly protein [Ahrensia sp.]